MHPRAGARFLVHLALACLAGPVGAGWGAGGADLSLNQQFIEGLQQRGLPIEDPVAMLEVLLDRLPAEVAVYPSENYFYFTLRTGGHELWGNLRLSARDRDQGALSLAYFDRTEPATQSGTPIKVTRRFTREDGVIVERRAELEYGVTFRGRTVLFRLHRLEQRLPQQFQLAQDEAFVARTFDESGYQFFLLFNTRKNYFLWVLNEEATVADQLVPFDGGARLSQELVVGKLSGFVFWVNRDEGVRKTLVGVRRASVARNDFYDGPFDQLADNHVEETHVAEYMQRANPSLQGRIDRYGYYLDQPGQRRVALTPYYVYANRTDLTNFLARAFLTEDPAAYVSQRGRVGTPGVRPAPPIVPLEPAPEGRSDPD